MPSSFKNPVLLVGNGSYQNRGCEAIVRGTMAILERTPEIQSNLAVTNGYYGDISSLESQRNAEVDSRILHKRLVSYPKKWSLDWFAEKANERCGVHFSARHRVLLSATKSAAFALEIGGDNYTLDYGFPQRLIDLDRWLMSKGVPVIIWGASIGPFGERPELEAKMMRHLARLKAVFVRESVTYDYLTGEHGLTNVSRFADPAFCLEPAAPAADSKALVADNPLCINISPLLYSYKSQVRKEPWAVQASDLNDWVNESAAIVSAVAREFKMPILLLPHVGSALPGIDDFSFLQRVASACVNSGVSDIRFPQKSLNAAESKYLISRCRLVMAARTHATIAGFSTAVPTVSIGYSQKARGINQDIFGTQEFCIPTKEFRAESAIAAVSSALAQETKLRAHLAGAAVKERASAMAAGTHLLELLASK
ncbi:polysaccharide pyruvyl transferase family protein [Synoicihabitans lomoniglobus]|uniref:Polysaccharide pyruvyl transferase family protein n=1 Tax=Synoicihabitans lomoniglobus TaxID=2909285 RepID=A0AAF0I6W9_9BACT|nr:polysaccharide pyruvyl transferase family protein [Opitutaceae bacterium LMO-M01]WED66346.1 polysaccharide pyruvyl transferase family protein [Opitutaceae bacterium LMO-M01]